MSVVRVELTHDEALVLFDWLAREDSKGALPTEDQAEQYVLWKVEGQLEKLLVEPLKADYQSTVDDARRRIKGGA